jgi:hypothetical protein
VLRGSHITMEQTRFAEGLRMPDTLEVREAAPAAGNPAIPRTGHRD